MVRQTLDLISEIHIINGPLTIPADRTDHKIILTDRDSKNNGRKSAQERAKMPLVPECLSDHLQRALQMLAPDWAEKILSCSIRVV